MKQPSKKKKRRIEKKFLRLVRDMGGLETDEGIIYPKHCELGTVYSPEECKKLGILI